MSEDLGTPAYQISRPSPSVPETSTGSIATYSHATETLSSTTPASTVGTSLEDVAAIEMTLSEEQIDRVINFILAYAPSFRGSHLILPLPLSPLSLSCPCLSLETHTITYCSASRKG